MNNENYHDIDGKPCSLEKLCRTSPEWAANRIRALITQVSKAEDRVAELEAVIDAARKLQDDMVLRADIGTYEGDHSVQAGYTVWSNFCVALAKLGKSDE